MPGRIATSEAFFMKCFSSEVISWRMGSICWRFYRAVTCPAVGFFPLEVTSGWANSTTIMQEERVAKDFNEYFRNGI